MDNMEQLLILELSKFVAHCLGHHCKLIVRTSKTTNDLLYHSLSINNIQNRPYCYHTSTCIIKASQRRTIKFECVNRNQEQAIIYVTYKNSLHIIPLDKYQLVITNSLLHNFLCLTKKWRLKGFFTFQIGHRWNHLSCNVHRSVNLAYNLQTTETVDRSTSLPQLLYQYLQ